jgi:phosphatidylinositol N-acetylglucosaminyltransferase subunit Q
MSFLLWYVANKLEQFGYINFNTQTRLAVILVHASIETILAFMNHFPLFALMLRVKDPARLPGTF